MSEAPTVPAHEQRTTLHLVYCYPEHEPRADDPHYALFNAARERLKRQGLLKCWVCGSTESPQLHHAHVEFALANGIDLASFAAHYPDLLPEVTDEAFQAFVEGDGNLTVLCALHHIGREGIHVIPYPAWQLLGCEKTGQPVFAEAEFGAGQTEVPDPDAPTVATVTTTVTVPAITGGTT